MESNFPKLAQPAQRALSEAGIHSLEQLTSYTEREIRLMHGIGPNALEKLREALSAKGLTFKKEA
jgi:DNA-directed RNA polymerase alpha subunit